MAELEKNEAEWIVAETTRPLQVGPAEFPVPGDEEVVIGVSYVAMNPSEWKLQAYPYLPLNYPHVLGSDVAGTVVRVGTNVTRLQVGQRVIGHCAGLLSKKAQDGAFQKYCTCIEILVSPVPDFLPLSQAVVLPLSISTAATGLYKHLKLPEPRLHPKPLGKKILIWGGSSSCGSSAIQLAVASGLTVLTTASKKNAAYVRDLGAAQVFDHAEVDVVERIIENLEGAGEELAGVFDLIASEETTRACARILSRFGGGVLPITLWPPEGLPENVHALGVNALDPGLVDTNIGDMIWRKYIPLALAAGKFQAKPEPEILKGGLGKVQEAMDLLKEGVSAKKIVVEVVAE